MWWQRDITCMSFRLGQLDCVTMWWQRDINCMSDRSSRRIIRHFACLRGNKRGKLNRTHSPAQCDDRETSLVCLSDLFLSCHNVMTERHLLYVFQTFYYRTDDRETSLACLSDKKKWRDITCMSFRYSRTEVIQYVMFVRHHLHVFQMRTEGRKERGGQQYSILRRLHH